jgi:hypothetical protein
MVRTAGSEKVALNSLLLTNLLVAGLGILYGFDYRLPPDWKEAIFRAGTVAWLAGLAVLLWMRWSRAGGTRIAPGVVARIGPWLVTGQLSIALFFFLPSRQAIIAIVALFGVGWLARLIRGPSGQYAVAVMAGFALFAASILLTPIDPQRADMLPVINLAIDAFASGHNPYAVSYETVTVNPFFYPPFQWLVFVPAHLAGLDVRIVNLLCAAAMVVIVERGGWSGGGWEGLRAAVYPLMFSALALPMMHSGQVWPYWLAITLAAILASRGSWTGALAALGVAAGMRQTALVPVAIMMVALMAGSAPRQWLRAGLVALAVLGVGLVPVALVSPVSLRYIFIEGPALALAHRPADNPLDQVAASNLLYHFGLERSALTLEAVAAAAFLPLAWMAGRIGRGRVIVTAGLAYLVVISFNPYLFRYYYVAGLLLVSVGIAGGVDGVKLAENAVAARFYVRRQVMTEDTA